MYLTQTRGQCFLKCLIYHSIMALQLFICSNGSINSVRSKISLNSRGVTNFMNASIGEVYHGSVSRGQEDIYHFDFSTMSKLREQKAARISVQSNMASENYPVLFVARLVKGVLSWKVPFQSLEGVNYHYAKRSLCPTLNTNEFNKSETYFYVDVSTASSNMTNYSLKAYPVEHFTLGTGEKSGLKNAQVSPPEPAFFTYTFPKGVERVLVKVTSNNKTCAMVLIQTSKCPIYDEARDDFSGLYATLTTKAAITVARKTLQTDKFYIVLLVKDRDLECEKSKGEINPFSPLDAFEKHPGVKNNIMTGTVITHSQRIKYFNVTIEKLPSDAEYVTPLITPIIFFAGFYLTAFLILVVSWCNAEDGGRSFFAYLMPSKVEDKTIEDEDDADGEQLFTPINTHVHSNMSYGAIGSADPHEHNTGDTSTEEIHNPLLPFISDNNIQSTDYDLLDDIDNHKDIYRLKKRLFLSDLSKKSYKKLQKKFSVYYWNLMTIAVFYSLPVIQLVLTYQRVVNTSGDQDVCYYNFLCARHFDVLSAFNNIYSNIGYVMLGILFVILVLRRDRLARQKQFKNPDHENKYGIPKHFGILYSMGYALIMEGVMSACYHVCPNYSNFQFDTAFMYIIGLLGCLRLYQTRHHDVFLNGHFAYASFAAVIFTSVIGVIFRSRKFWVMFLILHIVACLYISAQIYYMGRVKAAFQEFWIMNRHDICRGPVFRDRFILLLIFNATNWALSINGIVNLPTDFATYLLGIIVMNGLLYVGFYGIMKIRYNEKINLGAMLSIILSMIMWGASLSFFIKGLTNWQLSPAQSREGNEECQFMNFYDSHDIWHFLSSMGMFFSFLSLMLVDDDLEKKERHKINVF